jgi:hypothetical protein
VKSADGREMDSQQPVHDFRYFDDHSALGNYLRDPDLLSPWHMVEDFGKNNRSDDFSDALRF